MNARALATDMLLWEQVRKQLDQIEAAIKERVLEAGETQTVGNVRASFNQGRKTYDYESAVVAASQAEHHRPWAAWIANRQKTVTDWRRVCQDAGIEDVPVLRRSPPSVSIKILPGGRE